MTDISGFVARLRAESAIHDVVENRTNALIAADLIESLTAERDALAAKFAREHLFERVVFRIEDTHKVTDFDLELAEGLRQTAAGETSWVEPVKKDQAAAVRELLAQAWREGAQTSTTAEYAVNPYETHMNDARIIEALEGGL